MFTSHSCETLNHRYNRTSRNLAHISTISSHLQHLYLCPLQSPILLPHYIPYYLSLAIVSQCLSQNLQCPTLVLLLPCVSRLTHTMGMKRLQKHVLALLSICLHVPTSLLSLLLILPHSFSLSQYLLHIVIVASLYFCLCTHINSYVYLYTYVESCVQQYLLEQIFINI